MSPAMITTLTRYGLVGGLGFIVDAGLTLTLIHRGIDPFTARVFAICFAIMTTWRLNRALTFGASSTSQTSEGVRYLTVACLTAILNYSIYVGLLLSIPGLLPVFAIIGAVGLSTVVGYLGYSRFAFRTAV